MYDTERGRWEGAGMRNEKVEKCVWGEIKYIIYLYNVSL